MFEIIGTVLQWFHDAVIWLLVVGGYALLPLHALMMCLFDRPKRKETK